MGLSNKNFTSLKPTPWKFSLLFQQGFLVEILHFFTFPMEIPHFHWAYPMGIPRRENNPPPMENPMFLNRNGRYELEYPISEVIVISVQYNATFFMGIMPIGIY